MQLGALFEVVIYVRDMAAQVAFYRDTLGLYLSWPPGLADYSTEHWVTFDTGGAVLALHSGGEAVAGTAPRFGFSVVDIHSACTELLARGVQCGEVRTAAPGILILDCTDPEGHGFFLDQREQ
jgi:catechol 2,3-dioxygenase-like lactoylglutathione lyase family enzyme